MINKDIIEEVKNRLVEVYNPLAIYIFGSYAWGFPSQDSDLDVLIIIDRSNEKLYKRPILGHRALRKLNISKDLIVFTKDEFENALLDKSTLGYKIKKSGELIYARA